MSLKDRFLAIGPAFGEAFFCLALALRSCLRPGIVLRSSGLCLLMFGLWSWVFYAHFELIATGAGLISVFVVYGAATLGFLPSLSGGSGGGMGGIGPAFAMLLIYAAVLTVAVIAVLYIGLIVLSIRLALRWVLMDSLRARALERYPQLATRTLGNANLLHSGRFHLGPWLGIGIGPLLCLLVPVINGVLLLLLLAYLNVRFLVPAALSGLASGTEQMQAVRSQRGATIAFGLLILLLAVVPVLNLLLPALLGAGSCHLAYRGLDCADRMDSPAGAACMPQVSLPAP